MKFLFLILFLHGENINSAIRKDKVHDFRKSSELLESFKKNYKVHKGIYNLKKRTFALGGKAVPTLIRVMKGEKFPDRNRWAATFLLGKIMGKKSSSFIKNFLDHPNWVLRLASLKTLLLLKESNFGDGIRRALKDNSLLIRSQALENIKKLKLKKYSKDVWAMLFDKKNYHQGKNKKNKRSLLIKKVVKIIGELKFKSAMKPFLSLVQNEKYKDIFYEIDYSLQKISGKKSPSKNKKEKRYFWKIFEKGLK
jgi:hypothetical protein